MLSFIFIGGNRHGWWVFFFFFFDVAVYAKCFLFFCFLKQNVLLCSSTNKLQYGLSHGVRQNMFHCLLMYLLEY